MYVVSGLAGVVLGETILVVGGFCVAGDGVSWNLSMVPCWTNVEGVAGGGSGGPGVG